MEKIHLGCSEPASLVARSICKLEEIRMGEDGIYFAYITKNADEYKGEKKLVFEGRNWITIYDDTKTVYSNNSYNKYNVYLCCDEYDATLLIECIE